MRPSVGPSALHWEGKHSLLACPSGCPNCDAAALGDVVEAAADWRRRKELRKGERSPVDGFPSTKEGKWEIKQKSRKKPPFLDL